MELDDGKKPLLLGDQEVPKDFPEESKEFPEESKEFPEESKEFSALVEVDDEEAKEQDPDKVAVRLSVSPSFKLQASLGNARTCLKLLGRQEKNGEWRSEKPMRINPRKLVKFLNPLDTPTKIAVVVTVYNENEKRLFGTLKSIAMNLNYLSLMSKDKFRTYYGGEFLPSDMKVFVVFDGFKEMEKSCKEKLFSPQLLEEIQEAFDDKKVNIPHRAVLFKENVKVEIEQGKVLEMDVHYLIKEKNASKLDSHSWFFQGFCRVLNPKYCVLIDAGTCPLFDALHHLYKTMQRNDDVAGCAGEITINQQISLNPLVAAQQLEYKISCIIDKPVESLFGYITVLPGAFSAYRWEALNSESRVSPSPLTQYFHNITIDDPNDIEPFSANMYLAEDRILCFELVALPGKKYILQYVKGAVAQTDVPDEIVDLIKQRRRWLNGSLFALLYALYNWYKILRLSNHSWVRKLFLLSQYFYFVFQVILQWTAVSNLYLSFFFLMQQYQSDNVILFMGLRYLFLALIIGQIVFGLGNRPDQDSSFYKISCAAFGLLTMTVVALSYMNLGEVSSHDQAIGWVSLLSTVGVILILAFLYDCLFITILCFFQYLLFSATYIVIFPIYSLCNTNDVSWGTKNLDRAQFKDESWKRELEGKFQHFRSVLLMFWILSNGLFVSLVTHFADVYDVRKWYLFAVVGICLGMGAVRFLGSLLFIMGVNMDKFFLWIEKKWRKWWHSGKNSAGGKEKDGNKSVVPKGYTPIK